MAKLINQECGGAVVAPWEVSQLDDEWMDVFVGLTEIPKIRESFQAFDKRLEEIRRSHPNYRKYL